MGELGVNIDTSASFKPSTIAESKATWVRVVALIDKDLTSFIKRLHDLNPPIKTLLTIARESVEPLAWEEAANPYAYRYQGVVDAWQIGNEPDLTSPSSWTMNAEVLNNLIWTFRNIMPNEKIIGPGLASGDPSYLNGVDLTWVQGVAFHPYGQGTPDFPSPYGFEGNVEQLINRYLNKITELGYEKELWVSEWGANDNELGKKQAGLYTQAMMGYLKKSPLVTTAIHFCFSDTMVPGFGLKYASGRNKPAYYAFKAVAKEV